MWGKPAKLCLRTVTHINARAIHLSAHTWSGNSFTQRLKVFYIFFLISIITLSLLCIPSPKIIPFTEGDQQTGSCEPLGPFLCGGRTVLPAGWASWATPCCCWSTACFAYCRCCVPHCCSPRQAETSGPAVCQLSHLDIKQEREWEQRGGEDWTKGK